jgi:hypothetical protein
MKSRLLCTLLALACGLAARADFVPVPLNPSSFNADVVVEANATPSLRQRTTASIDGGTNNTGNTWFERGYNRDNPDTSGLPVAGSTFDHQSLPNRSYRMAPSYTENNAILINQTVTNATWTLTTPAAYGALSFISSGGNGGGVITAILAFQDGTFETNTFNCPDWFNGANPAWNANGRVVANTFAFANINNANPNPRLYARDITIANNSKVLTSIHLRYASGGGNVHNGIFCVSGAASAADPFSPIMVTGYNHDMIVEAAAPIRSQVLDDEGNPATTQTMDANDNTANTWYERGYNVNNPTTSGTNAAFSGLPPAGTVVAHTNGTRSYLLPPSWKGNNAAYLNGNFVGLETPHVTITPQTPVAATVLSFLGSSGGGQANLAYVITHQNGGIQEGTLIIRDWFNQADPIFTARGRVAPNTGQFDAVNSTNPRLLYSDLVLANTVSPVTSIQLNFTQAGPGPRPAIFAVSASSGDELPFFIVQPAGVRNFPGETASFSAVASGTGTVAYKWQKGTNGVYVDIADGGRFSGTTTTNLTITGFTLQDDADYRAVVSNSAGSVESVAAHLTVLSSLENIATPGDVVTILVGSTPGGEPVANAINGTTTKWLNWDADAAAPFIGPVGMRLTPSKGRTIVSGLRFFTANDADGRDPASYVLEGSNDGGASYTLISSNSLALPTARNAGGAAIDPLTQNLQQVLFPNTASFSSYRLSFPNVRTPASNTSMQIGEIEFLGVVDTSGTPALSIVVTGVSQIVGGNVTLTATVSGTPAPSLQWQKMNGETPANIAGATAADLTLTGVTFADAGTYRLTATNSAGFAISAPVTVLIFSALTDVTSSGDTITAFGNSVAFDNNEAEVSAFDEVFNNHRNRGSGFNAAANFPPFVGPVGLTVTPVSGATLVTGLRVYTSLGDPQRDPVDFKLEGSNDGTIFTEIAAGPLNLPLGRNNAANLVAPVSQNPADPGATTYLQEVLFSNRRVFTTYRLTFTNVRGNAGDVNSLQFGEIELLGVPGDSNLTLTVTPPTTPGGSFQLSWPAGRVLMEADVVTGPYTRNNAATSPFTVNPTASQKYYQVIVP